MPKLDDPGAKRYQFSKLSSILVRESVFGEFSTYKDALDSYGNEFRLGLICEGKCLGFLYANGKELNHHVRIYDNDLRQVGRWQLTPLVVDDGEANLKIRTGKLIETIELRNSLDGLQEKLDGCQKALEEYDIHLNHSSILSSSISIKWFQLMKTAIPQLLQTDGKGNWILIIPLIIRIWSKDGKKYFSVSDKVTEVAFPAESRTSLDVEQALWNTYLNKDEAPYINRFTTDDVCLRLRGNISNSAITIN